MFQTLCCTVSMLKWGNYYINYANITLIFSLNPTSALYSKPSLWRSPNTVKLGNTIQQCTLPQASCMLCMYSLIFNVQRSKSELAVPPHFAMLPMIPSFGDIVAGAKIIHSIYKALSDSMDASYDYQCVITELRSREQALKFIDAAITASSPIGLDGLDIASEIKTCLDLLKTFHDSISPYQNALEGGKRASWRKISWRKISWRLFKADEVANFRQKISQHNQNITLFLNALTM